ncbi:hypothetical protein O9929_27540 [Vibrio lentus]|nr:hypothetical protein [Vibrio lentus]
MASIYSRVTAINLCPLSGFVAKLPKVHLEGESYGQGEVASILFKPTVLESYLGSAWQKIDFMLFDMPGAAGIIQNVIATFSIGRV